MPAGMPPDPEDLKLHSALAKAKHIERAPAVKDATKNSMPPEVKESPAAVHYGMYGKDLPEAWSNNYVTVIGVEQTRTEAMRKVFIRGLMPQSYSERMAVRYVRPIEMMRTLFDWWVQGKILARFGKTAPGIVKVAEEIMKSAEIDKTTIQDVTKEMNTIIQSKVVPLAEAIEKTLKHVFPDAPILYEQEFAGTTPYELSIPIFFAVRDGGAKKDVYEPITKLEELMVPDTQRSKLGGIVTMVVPETVTVKIGQILSIPNAYLTGVSVDMNAAFDPAGYPVGAVATISVTDNMPLTKTHLRELRGLRSNR